MKLLDLFSRKRTGLRDSNHGGHAGSKFEHFDFGSARFECTFSSMSHAGECEDLFLNRYTKEEIMALLIWAGIIELCAAKGYVDPFVTVGKDDNGIHRFRLYDEKETPECLLMEVKLSELVYTPDPVMTGGVIKQQQYNTLAIEWLTLQSPREHFTAERPRLPGQDHPGLGGVDRIARLMETIAGEHTASAMLDVPSHFHAAVMYSRRFRFTDPVQEGMMQGVLRDLGTYSLSDLSWAFVTGNIYDAGTGAPVLYKPSEQILPIDEALTCYVTSREYRLAVDRAANERHYTVDLEKMRKKRKTIKR
jgi:hypothetical protein